MDVTAMRLDGVVEALLTEQQEEGSGLLCRCEAGDGQTLWKRACE